MNENIDLTKILEGCPEGTEFYHTKCGRVYFKYINRRALLYPIVVSLDGGNLNVCGVTKDGKSIDYSDLKCDFLLPSKEQRNWSKFERFWDKPKAEKFDPTTLQPFDKVLVSNINDWWEE